MRNFKNAVRWEFNSRLVGDGRNVEEAMLDALENSYQAVQEASPFVLGAIERNETWMIDGRFVQPGAWRKRMKDLTVWFLILVFIGCSVLFWKRYNALMRACHDAGYPLEYCETLGR